MKKIYISLILLLSFVYLGAGEWTPAGSETPKTAGIELISSDIQTSSISFSVDGFYKSAVETPRGTAWVIHLDKAGRIMKKGAPDLPKLTASVIIPENGSMDFRVISSSYVEFENIEIAPSKGNFTRDINPADVPYTYGRQYEENKFFPEKMAELRKPYIIRDYRGQTLVVYPWKYNPVSKTLRLYTEIQIEIFKSGENGLNELERNHELTTIASEFNNIYNTHFLNAITNRYDPVGEHGNMLIISHADFLTAVQPLADWRIQTGTPTEVVDVAEIGTDPSDIKAYIADYYNNNGLTFVLLVGDAAQVPPSYSNGDSDNDYSYVAGDDHYPDLFVGRFSAEIVAEVETQVERTLEYEQNPVTTTDWFSYNVGISSSQGPGDDNEYDYEHIRNIQTDLTGFTYTGSAELFDGSQGGLDQPGNPTPSMVSTEVNTGTSVINYTGHGSTNSWGSSNFSSSNVNDLTNDNMLPFIWSVACVNGNFVGTTCFAEAWLRAENNGEPTGAVATMMSTINQTWNPPMCGQDEMNDILVESYTNNIKRTFGGISMNGCMQMNDEYGSQGDDMTDTWTCFGDPALMVRTAMPQNITATYNPAIFIGAAQFTVSSNAEGGLVALTMDGEVLSTAFVEGGTAILEFDPLTEVGTAAITITAFNYIPHNGTVDIIPPDGPYVIYESHAVNDDAGNANDNIDYGETILLTVAMENIGTETAGNVTVTLSTDDQYISITDATENYGDIPAGETMSVADAFAFDVAEDLPDGHSIVFNIEADGTSDEVWTSSFSDLGHAAILVYDTYYVDDASGNNNGKLDPGETADLGIAVRNDGTADAYSILGDLGTSSEHIALNDTQMNYGDLAPGEVAEQGYSVSADINTPEGHIAAFDIVFNADMGLSTEGSFTAVVGQIPVLVIDMDENNNSAAAMEDCFANLGVASDYATDFTADLGMYRSIFVCLGVYSNNHQLTQEEGNMLAEYLADGGMLYMEGGDTWYYDDKTEVHEMFNIEGMDDGGSDLGNITGVEGSFAEGMSYFYGGDNNWIDHIEPIEPAVTLFSNENPAYNTAVAFDAGDYKTIGASFEFGGLDDGEYTKDELMNLILNFFNIETIWVGREENRANGQAGLISFPNPFKENISFEYRLDKAADVNIQLIDMTGQVVAVLENSIVTKGIHRIDFNGKKLPSGIYFCRLTADNQLITKKIVKSN